MIQTVRWYDHQHVMYYDMYEGIFKHIYQVMNSLSHATVNYSDA